MHRWEKATTVQVKGGDELPHHSIGVIVPVKYDRWKKNRKVMMGDIPGAFMQADIDKQLFLKFDADLVELLVQVEPTYQPYITYKGRQPVLYMELNKVLYGTLQAALLFLQKLSIFLTEKHGFMRNAYDWCVVNKMVSGKQCTVA